MPLFYFVYHTLVFWGFGLKLNDNTYYSLSQHIQSNFYKITILHLMLPHWIRVLEDWQCS